MEKSGYICIFEREKEKKIKNLKVPTKGRKFDKKGNPVWERGGREEKLGDPNQGVIFNLPAKIVSRRIKKFLLGERRGGRYQKEKRKALN